MNPWAQKHQFNRVLSLELLRRRTSSYPETSPPMECPVEAVQRACAVRLAEFVCLMLDRLHKMTFRDVIERPALESYS